MNTTEQNTKINELQSNSLKTCANEALKGTMQFHEVSEIHAKSILNNGGKVYGLGSDGLTPLSLGNFTEFEKYFID